MRRYRPHEAWYMELAKAVYRVENGENATDANNLLSTNTLDVYISDVKKYDPLVSVCDGILADDIMFVTAYQQAQGLTDAKGIRDLFLPIVLELPHSDLGRAIARKLNELSAVRDDAKTTQSIFEGLWKRYKSLFFKNQIIDVNSLLLEEPVKGKEQTTKK